MCRSEIKLVSRYVKGGVCMDKKSVCIFGGGTISWVRNHFGLCAPAYGTTAKKLAELCQQEFGESMDVSLYLTRMAGGVLETNDDVAAAVKLLLESNRTKIIFFSTAMIDFDGSVLDLPTEEEEEEWIVPGNEIDTIVTRSGKWEQRLKSKNSRYLLAIQSANKVIRRIRKERKDIFLVGFKQTSGASEDEQYIAGLNLCKEASCNLVLANDAKTRLNMIVTPEEARYHVTSDRDTALSGLVKMAKLRSHLTFTRSTVVDGQPISWLSAEIPDSLRQVVNYCIDKGAYKPFRGSTVGHFACKLGDCTFLTSQRRTNFNDLEKIGLVKIVTDGPDTVLAYGAKPSVGGQSQRIIFKDHPDMDCVVHFHCEKYPDSPVPTKSQYEFECGSHECGENTSNGLKQFGNLKAVYLDNHGPNIVFNKNINPQEVIHFIEENFDLTTKTGGYVA